MNENYFCVLKKENSIKVRLVNKLPELNFLIVDDNHYNIISLKAILTMVLKSDFQLIIEESCDGKQALEKV